MDPITILIPTLLRQYAEGQGEVVLRSAGTSDVCAVLDLLDGAHPLLGARIRDETGELRRYVNIYVDGEDVRRLDGLGTPVRAGATVMIMQSVAGG